VSGPPRTLRARTTFSLSVRANLSANLAARREARMHIGIRGPGADRRDHLRQFPRKKLK